MLLDYIDTIEERDNFNDYIYDLDIPDNHMFFANDILVHNTDSMFLHIEPILKELFKDEFDDMSDDEKIDATFDIVKKCSEYINNDALKKLIAIHDPDMENSLATEFDFNFKEELVMRRLLYMQKKKKYASWIVSKEGKKIDEISVVGIEIVRSDFSQFAKQMMQDVIDKVLKFDYTRFDLIPYVNKTINKCVNAINVGDISVGKPGSWGLRDYDKYTQVINAMIIYNTLFGKEFGRGSRGYVFYIKSINESKIDNYRSKYNDLINNGIIKEETGIRYIAIPYGTELDVSIFKPDVDKMLELNVYNRLKYILDSLDISIDNMYTMGW